MSTYLRITGSDADHLLGQATAIVRERYKGSLFIPCESQVNADFSVTLEVDGHSLCINDEFGDYILRGRLVEAFGRENNEPEIRLDLKSPLAAESFSYRLNNEEQRKEFENFKASLPRFLLSFFPMVDAKSKTTLEISEIDIHYAGSPYANRWCAGAKLELRSANRELLDESRRVLCNFFGPDENGTIVRPGRRERIPYDEIAHRFVLSTSYWLDTEAPKKLTDSIESGMPSIRRILGFD